MSDRLYGRAWQTVTAMMRYIEWYRGRRAAPGDVDWVGQQLIYDEFLFEEYNQTQIMPGMHAGNMSYSEKEDTIQHQFADMWVQRWRTHNLYKKYKLTLTDWFNLPYPDVEWLLKRARKEDEVMAERQQKEELKKAQEANQVAPEHNNAAELAYALRQQMEDDLLDELGE